MGVFEKAIENVIDKVAFSFVGWVQVDPSIVHTMQKLKNRCNVVNFDKLFLH